ncbi:hypothetical protein ALC53_02478 [Atta colombica]|uniref:Uncharacterized protein n=1 Tax=Atta colombica TaxID=520822 RepID=A0A195BSI2_9HYME|nr:hypothetical protein ALC53_02478 [Atta colombica]
MPRPVESLAKKKVVGISCSQASIIVIMECYDQLGISNKTNVCTPVKVKHEIGRIFDIAALHYNHMSIAIGERRFTRLKKHCIQMMKQHFSVVVQTEHFIKLDVNILTAFLIKAGKTNAFRM